MERVEVRVMPAGEGGRLVRVRVPVTTPPAGPRLRLWLAVRVWVPRTREPEGVGRGDRDCERRPAGVRAGVWVGVVRHGRGRVGVLLRDALRSTTGAWLRLGVTLGLGLRLGDARRDLVLDLVRVRERDLLRERVRVRVLVCVGVREGDLPCTTTSTSVEAEGEGEQEGLASGEEDSLGGAGRM